MKLFRRTGSLHAADALAGDAPTENIPQVPPASQYPGINPKVQGQLDQILARVRAEAQTREQRAVPFAASLDNERRRWYGWGTTMPDQRQPMARRYVRVPAPAPAPLPPVPVTAAESASRMSRLAYPPPDATRDRYAAVMRQVSAYTGTRSSFDWPAAWTSARPGQAEEPVTYWTPQHAPRLAIEAPEEAA
jgi:hypothetical protein